MASGNDLITAVTAELNRTDLDVGGANIASAQRALNDSLRDFFNRYPWSWRVVDPPMSIAVVSGTTLYDTSTGGTKIQDIYGLLLDTGDTITRYLREIPHATYLQRWANVAYIGSTYPVEFARRDQFKIVLAPKPSSSSWTLKLFYSTQFVDITDFTATISQVPDRCLETIKLMMLYRLYRWAQEDDRAGTLFRLTEVALATMVKEDKAEPALEFVMQPVRLMGRTFTTDYWKSPFVSEGF